MWLAVAALAMVGAIRVLLESLFKADVTWSLPVLWLFTQLAASVMIGALLGVHAPPHRRLVALLAPVGGIALMLVLAYLEDHVALRAFDPLALACPLVSLGASELVHRFAPRARSGPATTCILAASLLVGLILVCGIGGDEILHIPGWMIFAIILASGFVTGYLVQSLLTTRQVNGCAAAPLFILLRVLGGDGIMTMGVLVGSLVLALLSLWGAHRAWNRKLRLGTVTDVQVPAARAS